MDRNLIKLLNKSVQLEDEIFELDSFTRSAQFLLEHEEEQDLIKLQLETARMHYDAVNRRIKNRGIK
jgi:hypothetical protein